MAKILIIDDDPEVRKLLATALQDAGHEIREAQDGIIGLEKLKESPADLILCDIFMPNQEGLETITQIRRLHRGTPVIAMSGGSEKFGDFLPTALRLGAVDAVSKPVAPGALCRIVEQHLTTSNAV